MTHAELAKSTIWNAVINERHRLISDLRDVDDSRWAVETACEGWDVHAVLAHLTDTAATTRLSFARDMLVARLDFDRANEIGIARARRTDPADTLAELARLADRRTGPPAAPATRLVEAYVHGEDIRRALGISAGSYPPELLAAALRYQAKTAASLGGGRERITGLRLVADDVDCAIGDGAVVSGSAISLLLAVSGRPVADHELDGPGAAELRRGRGAWSKQDLWAAVHAERRALVDDLAALTPADFSRRSLCDEWTIEQVVAHLTAAARTGRIAWLRSILGARFDADLHNDRRLAERLGRTPQDTLAGLRDAISSTAAPAGATAAWLGEVLVHAQDIRHPIGIGTAPDTEAVVQVARFFAARNFAVNSRSAIAGLRVEADDAAFAAGPLDGEVVSGPVLALMMAMAGRAAYLEALSGPGVRALAARISAERPAASPAG